MGGHLDHSFGISNINILSHLSSICIFHTTFTLVTLSLQRPPKQADRLLLSPLYTRENSLTRVVVAPADICLSMVVCWKKLSTSVFLKSSERWRDFAMDVQWIGDMLSKSNPGLATTPLHPFLYQLNSSSPSLQRQSFPVTKLPEQDMQ